MESAEAFRGKRTPALEALSEMMRRDGRRLAEIAPGDALRSMCVQIGEHRPVAQSGEPPVSTDSLLALQVALHHARDDAREAGKTEDMDWIFARASLYAEFLTGKRAASAAGESA